MNQFTDPSTTHKSAHFPKAYQRTVCPLFQVPGENASKSLPGPGISAAGTPSFQQEAPSPPAGVGPPRRLHVIWSPLRRRAVLRRFALRTPRHDVVRRGWLAAILLLFLSRSLPLGKQRKCFGGLSIRSFCFPGPVVLPATPCSQPPLPLPSIRARRRLSKSADTLRLTLALAGKESEGVGAVIKAGPIGEGWRGAAWGVRPPGAWERTPTLAGRYWEAAWRRPNV